MRILTELFSQGSNFFLDFKMSLFTLQFPGSLKKKEQQHPNFENFLLTCLDNVKLVFSLCLLEEEVTLTHSDTLTVILKVQGIVFICAV